jgi:hypothetical protein
MSNHAGPAALYAMMPLAHDMIGPYFAVGSNNHLPPTGSAEALLGTNQPNRRRDPRRRGTRRGDGHGADRRRLRQGPAQGGAGRADAGRLVIGLLAGSLNGAAFGRGIVDFLKHPATATNTGQSVLALSVEAFAGHPVQEERRRGDTGHPRVTSPARRLAHLAARRAEPHPPPRPRCRRRCARTSTRSPPSSISRRCCEARSTLLPPHARGRELGAAPPQRYASLAFLSGKLRTGLPVAAWIALSTAGVTTQMVGSPTPPQKS